MAEDQESIGPGCAAVRGREVDSPHSEIDLATRANNPRFVGVSRFWLTYQKSGRLFGVVILDSSSLIDARRLAASDRIDLGEQFANGSELAADLAALMPATAIGRMLTPEETYELIERFDRSIPKRPPAPSIKRRAASGRKQA